MFYQIITFEGPVGVFCYSTGPALAIKEILMRVLNLLLILILVGAIGCDKNRQTQPQMNHEQKQGTIDGGGGDSISMDVTRWADDLVLSFNKFTADCKGQLDLNLSDFEAAVDTVEIQTTSEPLILHDKRVEAINYPDKKLIVLNRDDWLASPLKIELIIHEFRGILNLDDTNYKYSKLAANLLKTPECYEVTPNPDIIIDWKTFETMPYSAAHLGAIIVDEEIYILGGDTGGSTTNKFVKYNLKSREWSELPPMNVKRSHFGIVELNGFIYAIGGITDNSNSKVTYTNSVEKFDPQLQEWTILNNIPFINLKNDVYGNLFLTASVVNNRIITIINGPSASESNNSIALEYNETNDTWNDLNSSHNTGKLFDPIMSTTLDGIVYSMVSETFFSTFDLSKNQWKKLPNAKIKKTNMALGVYKNGIFSIGGKTRQDDSLQILTNVEFFNVDQEKWLSASTLPIPKHSMATIVHDSKIFVFGGLTVEGATTPSVEIGLIKNNEDQ